MRMTDRLSHTLKTHKKPVFWVCFSLAIVGLVLYLAQDPATLRVESPVAAEDAPLSGLRRVAGWRAGPRR